MSQEQFNDFNQDDPNQDPFSRLDLFQNDPRFTEILKELEAMQATYSIDNDIDEKLYRINEKLYNIGWIGDKAWVTGRVRIAPWKREDDLSREYLTRHAVESQEDLIGWYYDVADFPLMMALIDADEDQDQETANGRYVLSFHSPEDLIDVQDSPEDLHDILMSAGKYVIYPEDLTMIKFGTPSIEQIEKTLELYYPGAYDTIISTVREATGATAHRLLADLKELSLANNDKDVDSEMRSQIGRFLYDRTQIDDEADYRFTLNNQIGSLSVEKGIVEVPVKGEVRLSGKIVALDIDAETLQPIFIVGELSSTGEGYEMRVIPVESVQRLQCLRSTRSRLGSLAMLVFDSPEGIKEYWATERSTKEKTRQVDADNLLEYIATFVDTLETKYGYGKNGHFYELPIDEDIALIQNNYVDHIRALHEFQTNALDMTELNKMLRQDIERLQDLSLGDMIVAKDGALSIELTPQVDSDDVEYTICLVEPTQRLQGEFSGVVIVQVPSDVMLASGGSIRDFHPSPAIVLKNAVIIEQDMADQVDGDVLAAEVFVVLSSDMTTKFGKLTEIIEN